MVKEAGLADRLHYDDHERRSGLVRFLAARHDARDRSRPAREAELGDLRDGEWQVDHLAPGQVSLSREGSVDGQPSAVRKTIRLDRRPAGPRAGHRARDAPSRRPGRSTPGWASSCRATCWAAAATRRPGTTSAASDLRTTRSGEAAEGVDAIGLRERLGRRRGRGLPEPAADAWWSPIETVSRTRSRASSASTRAAACCCRGRPGSSPARRAGSGSRSGRPSCATRPCRAAGGDDGPRGPPGPRHRAMSRPRLVVHAHFYQPFRVDPFTGHVPPDASAAPFRDWNERVTEECYRPNAERGTLAYASWNLGPTLTAYLADAAPEVLAGLAAGRSAGGRRTGGQASPSRSTTRSCRCPRPRSADRDPVGAARLRAPVRAPGAGDVAARDRGRPRHAAAARGGGRRGDDPRALAGRRVRGSTRGVPYRVDVGGGQPRRRRVLRRRALGRGLVRARP